MTSREVLACAVVAAPAVAAVASTLAPRRTVAAVAAAGAVVASACRGRARGGRPGAPRASVRPRLGRRRRRRRPAGRGHRSRRPRKRARLAGVSRDADDRPRTARVAGPSVFRSALHVLGDARSDPPGRESRRGVAARRGDDRGHSAPGRLQRPASRTRGGLEVPDPHLARPRRGTARDRAARRALPARRARRTFLARSRQPAPGQHDAGRVPVAPCGTGGQDRLGARAQLASRRAFGGASSRLRAALRSTAAGGPARRLALESGTRARRSVFQPRGRCSSGSVCSLWRWRCRFSGARWRGNGCLPTPAWSTWA